MEKHDPFDLKGQDKATADVELNARLALETEEGDVKWLMSSKRGRRIIWRLLSQAGVFRSSFSTIAMQMAYNEGFRGYGNRTLELVTTHCSELFPIMIKENSNGGRTDTKS
jgi:hypothetical protein